jgi:hypothetical protein
MLRPGRAWASWVGEKAAIWRSAACDRQLLQISNL